MAENITSLLEKEALAAANALPTDVIYVVHGTGTPRDKKMTVAELRKLIGGAAGDITVNSITFTDGTSTFAVELGSDGRIMFHTGIKTENDVVAYGTQGSTNVEAAIDCSSTVKGLLFKAGNSHELRAYISYDNTGRTIVIHGDGTQNTEAIKLDGDTYMSSGKSLHGNIRTDNIYPQNQNGSRIDVHAIVNAVNVPNAETDIDISNEGGSTGPADHKPVIGKSVWSKPGAVKRLLNKSSSDKILPFFIDTGSNSTTLLTIKAHSYCEMLCIGYVTYGDYEYAVLLPNGGASGT